MDKRRFQSFEGLLLPKKSQPLGFCRLLKGRSLKKMEKKKQPVTNQTLF